MTWRRIWKAWVDGKEARSTMLSLGFLGVAMWPKRHRLNFKYQPEAWKSIMGLAGLALVLLLAAGERRGYSLPALPAMRIPRWALTGAGLLLLALPVCVCLLTAKIPAGHDALAYLPRLVEFHENLAHGVLLPRWAPDLGRVGGQPVVLFNRA